MASESLQDLVIEEQNRQRDTVNLIASENYPSEAVMDLLGSDLTSKYAEGYPGARYYNGNKVIDKIEELGCKRALELFGLEEDEWSVNIQSLSGAPANLAVYLAVLGVEDKGSIMAMSLGDGGHLSHGFKASLTGKLWRQISFGLDPETEQIDFEEIASIAKRSRPDVIVAGFTAYPRKVDFSRFREIADMCGAHLHADIAHIGGLVAGGQHPSPFAYADTVMATTHKTLRGPRSAIIWSRKDERGLPKSIDRAVFPGIQGGPHFNQIAAATQALEEASSPDFEQYAGQVVDNAAALAEELSALGWRLVSGGTDTHLILVDTQAAGISGKVASDELERQGIIVNKNSLPGDSRSPSNPSGIRIGTAAETTRGKRESDMRSIAKRIDKALKSL